MKPIVIGADHMTFTDIKDAIDEAYQAGLADGYKDGQMKTSSIVKKYEKLCSAYGKAASAWVEAWEEYESKPTDENKHRIDEAYVELESSKAKMYSFAEQEWQ